MVEKRTQGGGLISAGRGEGGRKNLGNGHQRRESVTQWINRKVRKNFGGERGQNGLMREMV